jgi:tRNA threonylcarbamoyladenosine biosynthesis protein TsaE
MKAQPCLSEKISTSLEGIKNTCITRNEAETFQQGEEWGRILRALVGRGQSVVLALQGGLGAGKTCLTKGIAVGFGVLDMIQSPTYTIIREYENEQGVPFIHIDAYRLRNAADFEAAGAMEYLEAGGLCVIEWSELLEDALSDGNYMLFKGSIEVLSDGQRRISLKQ